jgi:hypothetical protein
MALRIPILALFLLCAFSATVFSAEIPEEWVSSVVYLENVQKQGAGTGFIVGRPVEESDVALFLISNRHVLLPDPPADKEGKGQEAVAYVYFNKIRNDEVAQTKKAVLLRDSSGTLFVRAHNNPRVDVAAVHLNPSAFEPETEGLSELPYIPEDSLATEDVLKKNFVTEGDRVLILGFPLNLAGKGHYLPIARGGVIASYPLSPFLDGPVILIDSTVVSGSSGSPVFLPRLPYRYVTPDRMTTLHQREPYLLGIIGQQFSSKTAIDALEIEDKVAGQISLLNLGIAYKAETIRETIDQFGIPREESTSQCSTCPKTP